MLVQKRINFFFFPDMIAGSQNVHAGGKELFGAFYIDAHSAGGILGVGNDKIGFLAFDESRQNIAHRPPRRTPDDVS